MTWCVELGAGDRKSWDGVSERVEVLVSKEMECSGRKEMEYSCRKRIGVVVSKGRTQRNGKIHTSHLTASHSSPSAPPRRYRMPYGSGGTTQRDPNRSSRLWDHRRRGVRHRVLACTRLARHVAIMLVDFHQHSEAVPLSFDMWLRSFLLDHRTLVETSTLRQRTTFAP